MHTTPTRCCERATLDDPTSARCVLPFAHEGAHDYTPAPLPSDD
jgi:hypothetical protein